MKKVTLTIGNGENQSKITTNLSEREAGSLLASMVGMMTNCQPDSEVEMEKKTPDRNEVLKRVVKERCLDRPALVETHLNESDKPKSPVFEREDKPYRAITHGKKYLAFNRCKSCDSSFFAMAAEGDRGRCNCGKEFDYVNFIPAKYSCSCCGYTGFFVVNDESDISEVECYGCKSPTDMKYNEDKRMFVSLSLLK